MLIKWFFFFIGYCGLQICIERRECQNVKVHTEKCAFIESKIDELCRRQEAPERSILKLLPEKNSETFSVKQIKGTGNQAYAEVFRLLMGFVFVCGECTISLYGATL